MTMQRLICAAMLLGLLLAVPAKADINTMFSQLSDKVNDYLDLNTRFDKAEEDSWFPKPFTDTKSSVGDDLNDLLDKALECLLDDSLVEKRHLITKLFEENSNLEDKIADLKMQRMVVPEEKKAYEVWKDDAKDVEEKIERDHTQIKLNKERIESEKQNIRIRLARSGVELSKEEVDSLVNTVTGTDTLQAMVVLKNVQAILEKLKGIMAKENENIHIAKKYYGLFLLATQAYDRQIAIFEDRITSVYLPKLADLRSENKKLMAETEAKVNEDETYRNNLKAQHITEEAAELYEKVLKEQHSTLKHRRKTVGKILERAQNTYKTVSIAHNLYDTMSEGLNSYQSLMSLKLIDPVPFKNKDMEAKFMELTQKMRE
ncbi:hypothetical protein LJC46_06060 [Desulfovibrio sp. OttesenSCG-928-G15]|nr:hypothetical protein [Desulfovibrio sp. OttesenSCG-928-G15]